MKGNSSNGERKSLYGIQLRIWEEPLKKLGTGANPIYLDPSVTLLFGDGQRAGKALTRRLGGFAHGIIS